MSVDEGLKTIQPLTCAIKDRTPATKFGKRPFWAEIPIKNLRIEPEYQREIGPTGRKTIRNIVSDFRWSRFQPLSVAPIEDTKEPTLYAVIDGQHRATALATLDVNLAPCIVYEVGFEARADAFIAINTAVTAMTPLAKYHARLAHGDEDHCAVDKILRRHKVEVLKSAVASHHLKDRQTISSNEFVIAYCRFGETILAATLRIICDRETYAPGDLNKRYIKAVALAVADEELIQSNIEDAICAAGDIDFQAEYDAALQISRGPDQPGAFAVFAASLRARFRRALLVEGNVERKAWQLETARV